MEVALARFASLVRTSEVVSRCAVALRAFAHNFVAKHAYCLGAQGEMPVTRFGVSLPQDLLKEVDTAVRELGLRTRSKLIERALRVFLTEQRWQRGRGHVAGVILLIYDHHTVEALTELQHDYLSLIRSTTHVHLTPNLCLEAVVVEGSVQRVRRLVNALRGLSGIIELRTALVSIPSTKPRS